MAPAFSVSLPVRARFLLLGSSLLVGVFTFVYSRLVCSFICSLSPGQLFRTVFLLSLFHVGLRELLLRFPPGSSDRFTPSRKAHLLSVASWLATGLVGFLLHAVSYPSFPFGSHLKLALGYWLLGGALLSQVEHLLFEHFLPPDAATSPVLRLRERLGRRLLEGYVTFTIVPVLVLMLSLLRFIGELGGNRRFVLEAVLLAIVFTGTALVAAIFYGRSLRRDSERLLEAVRRVGQGDFQPGVSTSRPDELALVASGINEMADGLLLRERIREAFGRFVSPEVADEFIEKYARHGKRAEMGGSRREVVVLFSDLRDFTPLSESLPPETLIEVLNGYFAEMVAAIRQHGGMVDKFIGDALLVVFGLTEGSGRPPAEAAVAAALEMRKRLADYNVRLAERGLCLQAGIGIHMGEVVAGYLGSADRLEFTVIGHTVNVAARIESQARAPLPSLLFSSEVARRLGDGFAAREVGAVALKGVAGAVPLFTTEDPGSARAA